MATHLVARIRPPHSLLGRGAGTRWLWRRLRTLAPDAYACILMPHHLHLLAETDSPEHLRAQLGDSLLWFQQRFGPQAPRPSVEPVRAMDIPTPETLRVQLRHVLRNPVRAGLVADPLAWEWSTMRDLVGAVVDPWVTPAKLGEGLRRWPRRLPQDLHRYVSADLRAPSGTPFPRAAPAQTRPISAVASLWRATTLATRGASDGPEAHDRSRRILLGLAGHQGWRDAQVLARASGSSTRSARRIAALPEPGLIEPALLVLGDRRLLHPAHGERMLAYGAMPAWGTLSGQPA